MNIYVGEEWLMKSAILNLDRVSSGLRTNINSVIFHENFTDLEGCIFFFFFLGLDGF